MDVSAELLEVVVDWPCTSCADKKLSARRDEIRVKNMISAGDEDGDGEVCGVFMTRRPMRRQRQRKRGRLICGEMVVEVVEEVNREMDGLGGGRG